MINKFNKLWYQEHYSESEMEDIIASRNYIQRYIDLYCPELFSVPEDITVDNLQEFLEIILKYYHIYLFSHNELISLGKSVYSYFYNAYFDYDSDTSFPKFPKVDRRELAIHILYEIADERRIFPEDVPFILECLNAPDEQIINMYDKLENYFEQFDCEKRFRQRQLREDLIKKQRIDALISKWSGREYTQPLPIRPMGIELDLCYKKPKE